MSGKKCEERSARMQLRNSARRPYRIGNARRRHLAHATKSCGAVFAKALQKYYLDNQLRRTV